MHEVGVAQEQFVCHLIVLLVVLIVESGESLELHSIRLAAPEELLLGEFIPLLVAHSKGNIVVGLGTRYPSPEQQLLEVS